MDQPMGRERARVNRGVASVIGLVVGLVPGIVHAQTNIDQGKSAAEIFANDCATCHKTARGLANGRGSAGLASFLSEHYTASRDQAAALAAYVMGAGGGESAPAAQGRAAKPALEHPSTAVEEPKPPAHPTRETEKPEEGTPATARLRQPTGDENKRLGDVPSIMQEPGAGIPGHRPPAPGHALQPATASRGRQPDARPSTQEPAAVVAEPTSPAAPAQDVSPAAAAPSAAGPANTDSGEGAAVPRDNIPD
jgi:hypothetical protein